MNMENVVNFCKTYGFIFPGSEIMEDLLILGIMDL